MKKILIIFLWVGFALAGFATESIFFQKLAFDNYLYNRNVKRIFQDSRGFIWFGTEAGIYRYDGYKILPIKSNVNHPNLITSGNILCVDEDKQGRLWFGTDRGVNVIDQNNKVVSLFEQSHMQDLRINSILCDSQGDVWIGSENGIFVYKHDKTLLYYSKKKVKNSLPWNNVSYIFEDKEGLIWVALWEHGLCCFDRRHNSFCKLPPLGKGNNPFTIMQDKERNIWVGTWIDGLYKIKKSATPGQFSYTQFTHDAGNPNTIADNSVYSIVEDDNGRIWILSQLGLSVISDKSNYKVDKYNIQNIFKEGSNYLNHLIKDSNGNIWIATNYDGVYLAVLDKPSINSNNLNELKKQLGYVTVVGIIEDNNKVLLGLRTLGLYQYDRQTRQLSKISAITDHIAQNSTQPFVTDMAICRNRTDGSIWIAGTGYFTRFIYKNNKYVVEDLTPLIKNSGKMQHRVQSLLCDSKGRIWIGSRYGLFYSINNTLFEVSSAIHNVVSLTEDKNGSIWLGSSSQGICRLTALGVHRFQIKRYSVNSNQINSNQINSIYVDKQGDVWAATDNGGLNKFNAKADCFESQNPLYAIQDEDIRSIQEDDKGNLWLSSNNKIIKLNPRKRISYIFSDYDNERKISYRPGISCKGTDGRLYFGGGNGFSSFYPIAEKPDTRSAGVVITDIEINNQSIWSMPSASYNSGQKSLVLDYTERNVGFEFSSLNYVSPKNISYAYKLDGVDDNWVYANSIRRFASYNNLKMGHYTFQVRSTDENGKWLNNITTIKLTVKPAPWETWWAFLIYFSLAGAIIYMTYRNIRNRVLLKRDLLISNIEKQKTEELTQIKLKYFTNISHELLTPLTIISCLIDDFHFSNPDKFKQYNIMKSNISRLKRLLQQILDFRKVESGNMKLQVAQQDLVKFISNICWNNFDPLATKKNIQFTIHAPESLEAWFDADKIDKIMFNLLSNAFKYTPANGVVNVTVQVVSKNDIEYAQIFVSDTGTGIPQEKMPYIFDRFYGNELGVESNGIGLSLTKDLVELHSGVITVESQINIGTTFTITFPIERQTYSFDELEKAEFNSTYISYQEPMPADKVAEAKNDQVHILVVEDNPDLLTIIANSLSRLYNVVTAGNGVEALRVLKDQDVDLIVSDIMMPEMDGLTLCKTIKSDIDVCHIPVLLLTAKNQISDRIESYNSGADAYISKPFEMEVLVSRINNLILNRQLRNSRYKSTLEIHPKESENNSLDAAFLKTAIQMVEDNLDNYDFTHEQLIVNLNTSKSTMYRKIKSLTGLSPSEFVRNIRLKHACIMLQKNSGNISEIAFAVGFNDPKYFSTCFKSEFGVSPRDYVKNMQGDSEEAAG